MEHFGFLLGMICLLSASISLLFALVVFTLRHNAELLRRQEWATRFAATFFVLAEIYFLRFCNVLIEGHLPEGGWVVLTRAIDLVVLTSSGVTNYLLLLSGVLLMSPALGKLAFLRRMSDSDRARHAALLGLCLAGAIQAFGKWGIGPGWLRVVLNVPDAVLSTLTLLFMGYVLHRSISSRNDRLMAWLASASAVAYAALYLLYGLGIITYLVANGLQGQTADASKVADLVTFVLSLLLKFGLFFPGYSLMLMVSGPLEAIYKFSERFTRQEEEYVSNSGIVKSIREELEADKVFLDIKLPGVQENEIAHYSYPSTTNGHNHQEPRKLRHDGDVDSARVMATGEPYISHRGNNPSLFLSGVTELTVPLIFHNEVIASLKAVIGKRFSEPYLSNLKRITTMVTPAVQAYREMAALNKLSRDLARLQIAIEVYDMKRDLGAITTKLQNVIAPSASGIVIELGFDVYLSCCPQSGPLAELVNQQLDAALKEGDVQDGSGNYRWLRKEMKIPSGLAGERMDEQVFGKFVFGIENQGERKQHAPIGTNEIFRRALADLTTNTLLEFMRGYLNQLTDQLGAELSGLEEEEPEKWVEVVQSKARQARLLWAAARFEGEEEELFGEDSMDAGIVELIKRLEAEGESEKWRPKKGDGSLRLYSLEQPEGETHHVIRKELPESKAVLWLGVARPDFGPELDYVSPWRYFLDHFCSIADSALYRIRVKIQRRLQDNYVESLQRLSAANIITGNVKHNLVNTARSLDAPLDVLERALASGRLQCDKALEEIIRTLRPTLDAIKKDVARFRDVLNRDKNLVCSLDDVIAELCDALEGPFKQKRVRIVRPERKVGLVGVPWHAVTVAIDTVLDNSKDAIVGSRKRRPEEEDGWIKDEAVEGGWIKIELIDSENEDEPVFCEITDNGPGVPPHLQDKLFKEPVTGTKSHSHGLGSFLSALTLRSYHGEILLKHPKPVTVRLKFPRPPRQSAS